MTRASPFIVLFSVTLISIHYVFCTRAAGAETRKQSRHQPVPKGYFHSDHECLERCRNVRSSYHQDLNILSNRANQLSKNHWGMDQLAELVKALPDDPQVLAEASPKSLTLLVNSASKLIFPEKHKRTGKRALRKLAKEMARRDLSLWSEQDLAMGTNGLSKAEDEEITGALKAIAQQVSRRKVEGWRDQHLAMLANGLSKAEGDVITGALKAIAQEVSRRKVEGWREQHLAMLANGLCKAERDVITGALKVIAQEVTLRKLEGWKEQHLAMLANGLCKAEGDVITGALRIIAQEVTQSKVEGWKEQHLAMLANGLCKAEGDVITGTLKVIAQEVALRKVEKWKVQHLAMLVNGLCKAEGDEIARALEIIAQEVPRRKVEKWKVQHLAMLANGLCKAEGDEIARALEIIAQEVPRRKVEKWQERDLAMLASGLCKTEGKRVTTALNAIAKVVRIREKNWTVPDLAMLANGFSKAEGDEITGALEVIAQEATRRKLTGWTAQHLAMLANGLCRTESKIITVTLNAIAKVVQSREKNWTEQHLAMLANGLSKAEGDEITEALKVVAQEIHRQGVKRCQDQELAMLISGLGKVSGQPVFESLVKELVAREKPEWLPVALGNLCRLQLSKTQVQAGLDIVKALNDTGWKPEGRRAEHELAWCITLLHFVFDQQENETSREACELLNEYHAKLVEYSDDDTICPGYIHQKVLNDQWQDCFVSGYGQTHQKAVPLVPYSIGIPETSHLQEKVFDIIREQFANYTIDMEVSINGFPIDILIEEKICVEVDGPFHYVYSDQPGLCDFSSSDSSSYDPATGEVVPVIADQVQKYQRAKDHFTGYMLNKYGYSVFRIPYGMDVDSEQFHDVMQAIQEALDKAN